MAKMKPSDLTIIYNNIAKNKSLPMISPGTELSLHEVADRIELANKAKFPSRNRSRGNAKFTKSRKSSILSFMRSVHISKSGITFIKEND